MREEIAVLLLTFGPGGKQPPNMRAEIDGQNEDGAKLDDDGIHLPVAAIESETWRQTRTVQQSFRQTEVRSRTYGKKLGKAFNDSQNHGHNVVVQVSSLLLSSGREESDHRIIDHCIEGSVSQNSVMGKLGSRIRLSSSSSIGRFEFFFGVKIFFLRICFEAAIYSYIWVNTFPLQPPPPLPVY